MASFPKAFPLRGAEGPSELASVRWLAEGETEEVDTVVTLPRGN